MAVGPFWTGAEVESAPSPTAAARGLSAPPPPAPAPGLSVSQLSYFSPGDTISALQPSDEACRSLPLAAILRACRAPRGTPCAVRESFKAACAAVCAVLCVLGALPDCGQPLAAQTFGHAVPVPSVEAVRRVGPVKLDGRLDEPAWKAARPITHFTQYDPDWGQPPSQRTEVSFLYDDDALYIGAHMYDSAGARGVTTRLVRRDADFDSDFLQIVIDGYHDHLGRAFFNVNPSGSKEDNIGIGTSCCDASWDPVWEAATRIDSTGWTAEVRIPFSQLRFSRDSVQTWGLEVRRFIKRRNEQDDWVTWPKTDAGGPSRFGHLTGLRIPPPPRTSSCCPTSSNARHRWPARRGARSTRTPGPRRASASTSKTG